MSTRCAETGNLVALAGVQRGASVRIERILFDRLRTECARLGLREGEVVHCRRASHGHLLLATDSCGHILLGVDSARFISVRPAGD